ncbi:MAG TPA: hypothetical protein VD999_03305 [Vitreimonas sp.]|nr:hypothetical protein [Vitreimonas sp.]
MVRQTESEPLFDQDPDNFNQSDLEQYANSLPEVRSHYDPRIMAGLAQHMSDRYPVGIEIEPEGKGARFAHQPHPTVFLSESQAADWDLTEGQAVFIGAHELGHLLQYLREPDSYKEVFTLIEKWSKGNKLHVQAWKRFFNVFLDVHVNAIAQNRVPLLHSRGAYHDDPYLLYRDKSFSSTDYSGKAHSSQFIDYLLRRIMVPDQEVTLDEEVRALVDKPFTLLGVTYPNLEAFIRKEFYRHDRSLKSVVDYLDVALRPIFEKLLKDDEAHNRLQPENDPNPEYSEMGDAADAERFAPLDEFLKDANKTNKERSRDIATKNYQTRLEKNGKGLSDEQKARQLKRHFEMIEEIRKIKDVLWKLLQMGIDHSPTKQGGYTSGANLSTSELVRHMPTVLTDPARAPIFERRKLEPQKESIRPSRIFFHLQLDASGSVFNVSDWPEGRNDNVQDLPYRGLIEEILNVAYATAQGQLVFTQEGYGIYPDFPVNCGLTLTAYGSQTVDLFADNGIKESAAPPSPTPSKNDDLESPETEREQEETVHYRPRRLSLLDINKNLRTAEAAVWGALAKVDDLGQTIDAPGLELILEKVNQLNQQFAGEDILHIVVQITDGDTQSLAESQQVLSRMEEVPNVVAKAIQIKKSSLDRSDEREEKNVFKELWGNHGQTISEAKNLHEVYVKLLASVLLNRG